MAKNNSQPVVVTVREVEKIFAGTEAMGNLTEVARSASNVQRAAVMAAVGTVLKELQRAEAKAGAPVLTTPHHGPSTRLQSLIASGEAAKLKLKPLPSGGLESKFDTGDWFGWAQVAWEKLKNPIKHKLIRPAKAVAVQFPDSGRVAVLGDWGTGLYGAPEIAKAVVADPLGFVLLMHLGDVYYSGTKKEVKQRFLDGWPKVPGTPSRALNSNHEMYSGGYAYFDDTLSKFGQEASYFAYQNKHWTLVGLDVAYKDHAIDDEQVDWLKQILKQAGDRRVVLFSHHQLYSPFEDQGVKLLGHSGFRQVLDSKSIFAWYWGHEHRCVVFHEADPQFGILARCIGHSGMPQSRTETRDLPRAPGNVWAQADWRQTPSMIKGGVRLPAVSVLEGPNPFIVGEEELFSPHGYAVLAFDGLRFTEQVRDATGTVIYEKRLAG